MATHTFTCFDKFFLKMHADRTAVTVQPNKIVSNDAKDSYALLHPSYRKTRTPFLANPVHSVQVVAVTGLTATLQKPCLHSRPQLGSVPTASRRVPAVLTEDDASWSLNWANSTGRRNSGFPAGSLGFGPC